MAAGDRIEITKPGAFDQALMFMLTSDCGDVRMEKNIYLPL